MTKTEYAKKTYESLKELVRKDTGEWGFDKWYSDGIDCYLAREVIYLFCERNDVPSDILESASPEHVAKTAWEYVQGMEDFTRLWNSVESKSEVLGEFIHDVTDPGYLTP